MIVRLIGPIPIWHMSCDWLPISYNKQYLLAVFLSNILDYFLFVKTIQEIQVAKASVHSPQLGNLIQRSERSRPLFKSHPVPYLDLFLCDNWAHPLGRGFTWPVGLPPVT